MNFQDVRLERDSRSTLEFTGSLLAKISTRHGTKTRWTELTLWAADSVRAGWVVEIVGVSMNKNEVDRRDAVPCNSREEIEAALSRHGRLTIPGRQLIELAVHEDDELADLYSAVDLGVEKL